MNASEKDLFVQLIEFRRDWNGYISPEDQKLYESIIEEKKDAIL